MQIQIPPALFSPSMAYDRARKVTVLHEGSVLAEGSLADVQSDERVIEVYLGR